jgi:hypothetical protein
MSRSGELGSERRGTEFCFAVRQHPLTMITCTVMAPLRVRDQEMRHEPFNVTGLCRYA